MAFLGETQKKELFKELKIAQRNDIIEDIEKSGINSPFLDFTDVNIQQIGVRLDDNRYIYSQANRFGYDWAKDDNRDVEEYSTDTIALGDYDEAEIENKISGRYDSVEDIKKEYGGDYKQIIAECIFEYEN